MENPTPLKERTEDLIALTTQNPCNGGGLRSTLNMFCHALKRLDLNYQLYFDSRQRRLGAAPEQAQGFSGIGVGQMLGRLGSASVYLNQPNWTQALKKCSFGIANTGAANQAYVFKFTSRPFATFVSSELYDDWAARFESLPNGRKKWMLQAHLKLWETQEAWALKNTKWIFTNSNYTSQKLIAKYGSDLTSKMSVLPLYVDYESFKAPSATRTSSSDKVRLVVTGRLDDARKNLNTFLRGLMRLKKETIQKIELDLVGGVPEGPNLKLIEELQASFPIRLHENLSRAQLVEVLSQSDLFILTSSQEGFGVAALEALACGVPVLSTKCGGPEDFIHAGVNGDWINSHDSPEAFARNIEKYVHYDDLRTQCAKQARASVISKFNEETFSLALHSGLKMARLV